jgi:hypothetical protein
MDALRKKRIMEKRLHSSEVRRFHLSLVFEGIA